MILVFVAPLIAAWRIIAIMSVLLRYFTSSYGCVSLFISDMEQCSRGFLFYISSPRSGICRGVSHGQYPRLGGIQGRMPCRASSARERRARSASARHLPERRSPRYFLTPNDSESYPTRR